MKTLTRFLIALIAMTVVFTSCNKEPLIVGRWQIGKITFENQMVGAMLTGYTQQMIGEVIEFRADGTVTANASDTVAVDESNAYLHYSLDGNNITFTIDMDEMGSDTAFAAFFQQNESVALTGTYEILNKTKLKLNLSFPLPPNQMNLSELKFTMEADRQ